MVNQSPSGTYNFFLDNASILLEAYDRIGIRPSEITREHIQSGKRSLNLALQTWSNRVPDLWAIELQSIDLVEGVATYTLPQETSAILDVYVETVQADSQPEQPIDRILMSISRTDYAMIPNKTIEAPPTSYWFDRLNPNPTITLWPAPDGNGPYTLFYYVMRRLQDASPTMGQTPEIPYRFLEALCADVAARLALKYMKDLYQVMKQEAAMQWQEAFEEDKERVPIYIQPELDGYWT